MAPAPISRNAFADPTLPTLADIIERLRLDTALPYRKKQDWRWALNAVARAVGKVPLEIPAHPEFIRKALDRAAPAAVGIGPGSWNNARSLAGKALEWAGIISMPGHYQAPFSPEWDELHRRLPPGKTALRMQLARLFHFCSASRISPGQVDDAVLSAFYDALVHESMVEGPYAIQRGAAKSWNNALDTIAGWPGRPLTVPSRSRTFSLPWSAFPASLEAAVEDYCCRAAGKDLLDEHFTRAQRPETIETRRKQCRLLASAVVNAGVAPAELVDVTALLAPQIASRGVQYLITRNGGQTSPQISDLAGFLPALARRISMPDGAVQDLRRMAKKIKVVRHGLTEKNRRALRAFDDPQAVQNLLRLPDRLFSEVARSGRRGYREAKLIQTAVAVRVLLNAPVRLGNLVSIEIDRHLLISGRTDRQVHLRFPAAEVKNAHDLEFPLTPETVQLLRMYLADWRPLLCPGPTHLLFPGKGGAAHKHKSALGGQITETVHAYTGLEMNPHRFWHAAAKIFLDRNPGQYEVVRLLLGHKSVETTIAFYAGAETATAVRHYAKTVLGREPYPGAQR